jgi:mannose-6-phosphate isomerase-like protein (cupin superfamily)
MSRRAAPVALRSIVRKPTRESRMSHVAINLQEKLGKFTEHWSPKVVAEMNDYQFKLVKIEGEFVWHSHTDTDEVFLVIDGSLRLEFRDGAVTLRNGEMYVVRKGVEHRPVAETECRLMLIEPRGVANTGDAGGAMTAPNDVWI